MPDSITTAQVQEYKANVAMLQQQMTSRLVQACSTGDHVGTKASIVEQFGEATAQKVTTRHDDTPLLDLPQDRRWVHPVDYDWGSAIDKTDRLRLIIDPNGPYTVAAASALERAKDDEILDMVFATNYIGEQGTTAETFDTTNYQVGVNVGGTASSLNVAKLQEAVRMHIGAAKGELTEPLSTAIGQYEHDALLKEVQIHNKDYGGSAVLVDGVVRRFMGQNFILTERLNISSGNRLIPCWRKSGLYLGIWQDKQVEVGPRPDKRYMWQVYVCQTLGATRTEAGKVVQILCDDQI